MKLDNVIETIDSLHKKAQSAKTSNEAMQFSQAALNVSHSYGVFVNARRELMELASSKETSQSI